MRSARIRPTVSIGPPAANGTTSVTGRVGQSCAAADAAAPMSAAPAAITLMTDMGSLLLGRSTLAMVERPIMDDPTPDQVPTQRLTPP